MMIVRAIDQVLLHHIGTRRSGDEVASAAVDMFETLLFKLSPILGHAGSRALFRRSLHLSEEAFPCYTEVRNADDEALMKGIEMCLRERTETAREASAALLHGFISLLATFIGERLTWQLLREAWPEIIMLGTEERQQ